MYATAGAAATTTTTITTAAFLMESYYSFAYLTVLLLVTISFVASFSIYIELESFLEAAV